MDDNLFFEAAGFERLARQVDGGKSSGAWVILLLLLNCNRTTSTEHHMSTT